VAKFVNGDVVTDGKRTGVIADGFYWRDSDDGSMNEPKTGFFPVVWDNGTQGYHHESELQYA
jgi:hypothetical protein